MRALLVGLLLACCAVAHVISMSSGWVTVEGKHVEYLLRIPAYETSHIKDPAHTIFDHIRFTSGFETARRTSQECHDDPASGNYVCAANYEFTAPVDKLGVECTFHEITVTNHIHMLRATRGTKTDQAILDAAFPSATLAFRPPTVTETALRESGAGLVRVFSSAVQILLLIAVVLAARSGRELLVAGAAFLAGEAIGTLGILRLAWQPAPRFSEAAAALGLAYLALEILAFPKSSGRWLLAFIFGGFEGMYFALFVSESGYNAGWVLTGAAVAGVGVLTVTVLAGRGLRRLPVIDQYRLLLTRLAATALMVTGAVWFTIRLKG